MITLSGFHCNTTFASLSGTQTGGDSVQGEGGSLPGADEHPQVQVGPLRGLGKSILFVHNTSILGKGMTVILHPSNLTRYTSYQKACTFS
jgi:hypothetical protein